MSNNKTIIITAITAATIAGIFTLLGVYLGSELGNKKEIESLRRNKIDQLATRMAEHHNKVESLHRSTVDFIRTFKDDKKQAQGIFNESKQYLEEITQTRDEVLELIYLIDLNLFILYGDYFSSLSDYMDYNIYSLRQLLFEEKEPDLEILENKYGEVYKSHYGFIFGLSKEMRE